MIYEVKFCIDNGARVEPCTYIVHADSTLDASNIVMDHFAKTAKSEECIYNNTLDITELKDTPVIYIHGR